VKKHSFIRYWLSKTIFSHVISSECHEEFRRLPTVARKIPVVGIGVVVVPLVVIWVSVKIARGRSLSPASASSTSLKMDRYVGGALNSMIQIDGVKYERSGAGLAAAITAASQSGGGQVILPSGAGITVDNQNAIEIPANVHVVIEPGNTLTCAVTAANTPCFWIRGSGGAFIGGGSGDSGEGADPPSGAARGATNLICRGCGSTTDMIRVAIPNSSRTTLSKALIFGTEVGGFYVNMSYSGRDVLYVTSSHNGRFHDITGFNFGSASVGANGFHLEGDCQDDSVCAGPIGSAKNVGAESYTNEENRMWMQPSHADASGAGLYIDALNGEVAFNNFGESRFSGNIKNGGGLAGMLIETRTGRSEQSADSMVFHGVYFGNASNSAQGGGWGIKLKANGAWTTNNSNGTINNIRFENCLIEHYFGPTSGTGIGGVDALNNPNGSALGAISIETNNFGGWNTDLDKTHLGERLTITGTNSTDAFGTGTPSFWSSGTSTGPFAQQYRMDGVSRASGANQALWGFAGPVSFHDGGFPGQAVHGIEIAPTLAPGATDGNFSEWTAAVFDGSGIPRGRGLWVRNSPAKFDGQIQSSIATGTAPFVVTSTTPVANLNVQNATEMIIGQGISNSTPASGNTGFQHKRVDSCITAAAAGSVCTTRITWSSAFSDTNYTVECSLEALSGTPYVLNTSRKESHSVLVTVGNFSPVASRGTINCIAVHD
jgi:hypothetical protein